jgi:hypothetical protein
MAIGFADRVLMLENDYSVASPKPAPLSSGEMRPRLQPCERCVLPRQTCCNRVIDEVICSRGRGAQRHRWRSRGGAHIPAPGERAAAYALHTERGTRSYSRPP